MLITWSAFRKIIIKDESWYAGGTSGIICACQAGDWAGQAEIIDRIRVLVELIKVHGASACTIYSRRGIEIIITRGAGRSINTSAIVCAKMRTILGVKHRQKGEEEDYFERLHDIY